MRSLLIFDSHLNTKELKMKLQLLKPTEVYLFCLTSQWQLIHEVEKVCQSELNINTAVTLLESSHLIDNEVDFIRENIFKWTANFGNYKIDKKTLKEWFLLPEGATTSWWFSLLSEKNVFKTKTFFHLAQVRSIDKIIDSGSFNSCITSVSETSISLAIQKICNHSSIKTLSIPQTPSKRKTLKSYIKSFLNREETLNTILKTLVFLCICCIRAIKTRLMLGSIKNRIKKFSSSILFISYFPSVNKKEVEKGILENQYATPLQEKLTQMGRKITWIWMYVPINGYKYQDALRLTKIFSKNGEDNYLLEEFLTLKVLIRTLFLWARQTRIFLKLEKSMSEKMLCDKLLSPKGANIIKPLMRESFVGFTGLQGLLYFELYKKLFSSFTSVPYCIYYAEMQAWEKALNSAKKFKVPKMKSIGFQHGSICKNHFFYFYHPIETTQMKKSLSLPLPDTLACNGDIPMGLMGDCGYPNLKKVEAIRYLHLRESLDKSNAYNKKRIVLIATSLDEEETKALISLVYETFPKPKEFNVCFKGHPSLSLKKVFEELKIDFRNCGYVIKDEPISNLLKDAKILIVGSSGVAVEALAYKCKVIIPIFSDSMFMSPLVGFEKYYQKVSTPTELKYAVKKSFEHDGKDDVNNKNFVSRYWCLDQSLKRWEELLA